MYRQGYTIVENKKKKEEKKMGFIEWIGETIDEIEEVVTDLIDNVVSNEEID